MGTVAEKTTAIGFRRRSPQERDPFSPTRPRSRRGSAAHVVRAACRSSIHSSLPAPRRLGADTSRSLAWVGELQPGCAPPVERMLPRRWRIEAREAEPVTKPSVLSPGSSARPRRGHVRQSRPRTWRPPPWSRDGAQTAPGRTRACARRPEAATVRAPGWPRITRFGRRARRRRHPPVPRTGHSAIRRHFTVPGGYPISGCHPWWVVRRLGRAGDGGGVEEHPRGAPWPTIALRRHRHRYGGGRRDARAPLAGSGKRILLLERGG